MTSPEPPKPVQAATPAPAPAPVPGPARAAPPAAPTPVNLTPVTSAPVVPAPASRPARPPQSPQVPEAGAAASPAPPAQDAEGEPDQPSALLEAAQPPAPVSAPVTPRPDTPPRTPDTPEEQTHLPGPAGPAEPSLDSSSTLRDDLVVVEAPDSGKPAVLRDVNRVLPDRPGTPPTPGEGHRTPPARGRVFGLLRGRRGPETGVPVPTVPEGVTVVAALPEVSRVSPAAPSGRAATPHTVPEEAAPVAEDAPHMPVRAPERRVGLRRPALLGLAGALLVAAAGAAALLTRNGADEGPGGLPDAATPTVTITATNRVGSEDARVGTTPAGTTGSPGTGGSTGGPSRPPSASPARRPGGPSGTGKALSMKPAVTPTPGIENDPLGEALVRPDPALARVFRPRSTSAGGPEGSSVGTARTTTVAAAPVTPTVVVRPQVTAAELPRVTTVVSQPPPVVTPVPTPVNPPVVPPRPTSPPPAPVPASPTPLPLVIPTPAARPPTPLPAPVPAPGVQASAPPAVVATPVPIPPPGPVPTVPVSGATPVAPGTPTPGAASVRYRGFVGGAEKIALIDVEGRSETASIGQTLPGTRLTVLTITPAAVTLRTPEGPLRLPIEDPEP